MSIKILPARLANQIAAGEVVERPASVVKELLENSLDAGATKIEVDIVKGGHKKVLIRDNGKGIDKDELTLALSRHATSKISTLEDLENIESLGFRGEALASISSVSRLTLTSRTQKQEQAWQAQCEGRDMNVVVTPAAHPQGTSVDVQDLFFNTPARRKFLRTEKTEFTHIDELFKRAALSHYHVHFILRHNDKVVRNYPVARNSAAKLKRVTQICGRGFENSAIEFSSQYQDIHFYGWVSGTEGARSQNDQQYVYINGRMMKDKLIAHAIRQAYEGLIPPDNYPAYVVYLTMPTHMLDVNVHPTKQEVRFHQARLVHDFIYKSANDTLQQYLSQALDVPETLEQLNMAEQASQTYTQLHDQHASHQYIKPLESSDDKPSVQDRATPSYHSEARVPSIPSVEPGISYSSGYTPAAKQVQSLQRDTVSPKQFETSAQNYQKLMQTPAASESSVIGRHSSSFSLDPKNQLVRWQEELFVVATCELARLQLIEKWQSQVPVSQPLLMPVAVPVSKEQRIYFQENKEAFLALGIELVEINTKLVLRKIPAGYRHLDWASVICQIIDEAVHSASLLHAFAVNVAASSNEYEKEQQTLLWNWFEGYASNLSNNENKSYELKSVLPSTKKINLQDWLAHHE